MSEILPPVLYWSPTFAAGEPDEPLAGLIDLTVATVPCAWRDGQWHVIGPDRLPVDRLRLVVDHTPAGLVPASADIEGPTNA